MTEQDHAAAIAALNDARRAEPGAGWVLTPGVQALVEEKVSPNHAGVSAFNEYRCG
jgi:hypothetical protein